MRVANPRQGDFAEPDQGFKGEGPGLAHLPHRCGTSVEHCNRSAVPAPLLFLRFVTGGQFRTVPTAGLAAPLNGRDRTTDLASALMVERSEERRVGKEC